MPDAAPDDFLSVAVYTPFSPQAMNRHAQENNETCKTVFYQSPW